MTENVEVGEEVRGIVASVFMPTNSGGGKIFKKRMGVVEWQADR
jgi:hypothetical protein